MADFTSALYLGLRHDSRALGPFAGLTTGAPAALSEPPAASRVAAALARRIGTAAALLGASTLHLFHDLFELLAQGSVAVLLDAAVYPIARWGAERAALAGAPLAEVRHYDAEAMRRAVARCRRRPVVVTDGFCPGCGRAAPLGEYLEAARSRDGWLVVDDTQALGVLGRDADEVPPYGRGGGGTVPRAGIAGEDLLVIASLAKGWGAPLAVAAGPAAWIARLEEAPTRVHCSPPAWTSIRAAEHALAVDAAHGEALRRRLAGRVGRFRARLSRAGVAAEGGMFPIQRLRLGGDVLGLYRRLLWAGTRPVLLRARCSATPELSFLLTSRHEDHEIDAAVDALRAACDEQPSREPCTHSTRPSIA